MLELILVLWPLSFSQNLKQGVVFVLLASSLKSFLKFFYFVGLIVDDFFLFKGTLFNLVDLIFQFLCCTVHGAELFFQISCSMLGLIEFVDFFFEIGQYLIELFIFFFESICHFFVFFLLFIYLRGFLTLFYLLFQCFYLFSIVLKENLLFGHLWRKWFFLAGYDFILFFLTE